MDAREKCPVETLSLGVNQYEYIEFRLIFVPPLVERANLERSERKIDLTPFFLSFVVFQ
jgi:hypothetical protein